MNKWLSAEEVGSRISEFAEPEKLLSVLGLSIFVDRAFYAQDFEPDARWEAAVALTEAGQACMDGRDGDTRR